MTSQLRKSAPILNLNSDLPVLLLKSLPRLLEWTVTSLIISGENQYAKINICVVDMLDILLLWEDKQHYFEINKAGLCAPHSQLLDLYRAT